MKIPTEILTKYSPTVREMFTTWDEFLYSQVNFNRPESSIHSFGHCERVLLHSLIIGESEFGDDPKSLTALAHASVFHDTRRIDDYMDKGHGARAALYYKDFCRQRADVTYMPEAALMIKYHDMDDAQSKKAIAREYTGKLPDMYRLYDIFKDADALDRWRLGPLGLDPNFLRTQKARTMSDFALFLVDLTMPEDLRNRISAEVQAKWIKR